MDTELSKASEILLEFQKELLMPVEEPSIPDIVEISELLMDVDSDTKSPEMEFHISSSNAQQAVSQSRLYGMSAQRVTDTPTHRVYEKASYYAAQQVTTNTQMVSVEINSVCNHTPLVVEMTDDASHNVEEQVSSTSVIVEGKPTNGAVESDVVKQSQEQPNKEDTKTGGDKATDDVSTRDEINSNGDKVAKDENKEVSKDNNPQLKEKTEETKTKLIEPEIVKPETNENEKVEEKAVVTKEKESGKPVAVETSKDENSGNNGVTDAPEMTTKAKKKKVKELDHISRTMMQALNGLNTPEEKIAALCKKYADLTAEHRLLTNKFKLQQKQFQQLQREKDHLQSEHSKAVLAKSKLESLCRELQRHNKVIKDESLQRARDEEEKRKELSQKFQQTINDITTQMQENHNKNIKLKEENLELASKLKGLVEQYERREEHIEKMFKHKELELQLSDAKLQQSTMQLAEEKDRNLREKTILITETADYQRKCEVLQEQELQLRSQLEVYTEKFEEFQTTLTKSNEVFQQFKHEMDKMTKKIKKLEKETHTWRTRWENSNRSLLKMAEEKTIRDKEMLSQASKIQKLEKLCRALQAERNALAGKAKDAGGSGSSSPTPTPPPASPAPPEPPKPSEPDNPPTQETVTESNKANKEEEDGSSDDPQHDDYYCEDP
ncbi:uncharacterized protein LOC100371254 [Saccoglossus kowalevskii]